MGWSGGTPLVRGESVRAQTREGHAPEQARWRVGDRISDYVVRAVRASRGGVWTLEADEVRSGERVSLRLIPRGWLSEGHQAQLEVRAARLGALAQVQPQALARDEGAWACVAQPWIDGEPLAERIQAAPLAPLEALQAALSLARALEALHRQGITHGGVSPHNVFWSQGGWVLADVGLSRAALPRDPDARAPTRAELFWAPEVRDEAPAPPSADLFLLGATLAVALLGLPAAVEAQRDGGLRAALLEGGWLRGLGLDLPEPLELFINRLCRADPALRFAHMGAAREALEELERTWNALAATSTTELSALRRAGHDRLPILGRAQDLSAALSLLGGAERGSGALLLLEAPSGSGKTRLLEELAWLGQQRGARVIRCLAPQDAQQPLEGLQGVFQAIYDDGSLSLRVADALGAQMGALHELQPTLARALGYRPRRVSAQGEGEGSRGEARSLDVLSALIGALGDAQRPALLLLDDAQWIDAQTAESLARWWRRGAPARCHVVVALAVQEDTPDSERFRGWAPRLFLSLQPLNELQTRLAACAQLGRMTRRAQDFVVEATLGSPLMIFAVLQGLKETDGLVQGARGWDLGPDAQAQAQASEEIVALLQRRMARLPADTALLLSIGAVLGRRFDIALVSALADLPLHAALRVLRDAQRAHLVWIDEDRTTASFVHELLRGAVLERSSPEERQALHFRAAEHLRQHGDKRTRDFALAYHYDAARRPNEALPFAVDAAHEALRRYAFDIAERNLRIAHKALPWAPLPLQATVLELLGYAMMMRGYYDEAAQPLQLARELATDPVQRAQIDERLGELAFKKGEAEQARVYLERGVAALGRPAPRSPLHALAQILREAAIQVTHTLAPGRFVGRRATRGDEVAVRLMNRLGYVYWFLQAMPWLIWTMFRVLNLAEARQTHEGLVMARANHAMGLTAFPWFSRANRYAELALAHARELRSAHGEVQAGNIRGIVLCAQGRWAEARGHLGALIEKARLSGERWEWGGLCFQRGFVACQMGRAEEALEDAATLYRDVDFNGETYFHGGAFLLWAMATDGRVPASYRRVELRRHDDPQMWAMVNIAEALCRLTDGDVEGAWALSSQTQPRAKELRAVYTAPAILYHVRVCRRGWEAADDRQRGRWRRRWRVALLQAWAFARQFPAWRPWWLVERARWMLHHGRAPRALALAQRALDEATQHQGGAVILQALQVRGRARERLGLAGALDDLHRAEALAKEALISPERALERLAPYLPRA